jgi:hypothetical protein
MPTAPPNTFTQAKVFCCFSPVFAVQSAIGTALAQADLTARLNLPLTNKPMPTRRITRDETRDCTGRYLIARRLTSRLTLYSLTLTDVNARTIAGFLAWAQGQAAAVTGTGAPYTEAISHADADQLAPTSLIIGAENSDEPVELYKDLIINTLDIETTIRQKVSLRASFIGSGDVEVITGFTAPACSNLVALYAQDCALVVGGTDYTTDLRSFRYSYNNNLAGGDDPFVFDDIDLARLERGEQGETSQFNFGVYGTKTHALYIAALAEAVDALSMRFGVATEGTTIAAAGAQLTLGDPPIGYAGEKNRSVVNLVADPFSVSGAKPDATTYVGTQNARLAQVPA